jgi:ATP-binding cassette, subfamily C (CFTR/MRP), member 1
VIWLLTKVTLLFNKLARSALMTDIFKKSLSLKNPMETGEIVNRFSSDTSAVTGSFAYLHLLWAAPIEIAVTLYLLYDILGPSSFIALATSLLIGFISYLVVPLMVRKTEAMLLLNDRRINLVNGTINFAQTIKLYGWENVFVKKITLARNAQLKELGSVMVITAFIGGLMSSAVNLIILTSLGTYALTAPADKPLDLARIFVGMSLLNTLQSPLNTISGVYSQVMQLSISFRRLTQLLCADEVEGQRKIGNGKVAISIRDGCFKTFGDEPKRLLKNVNVDIPRHKLTAVVGPTGCGKSSLLGAFSGGILSQESGKMVKSCSSMVFLPQQPWIFTGSIRENILFHAPYEPEWYKMVVSVSALKPDFEIMKGKDMAEMTDGNNLSGGQKQRVALARAVYSKTSEVYLFDDPLSAVDARVSAQIFEQIMGNNGVLKDKTRVLTTNRLDLLPKCDHIVVMENGTVLAQGTFRDLMARGSPEVKSMIQPQLGIPMASVREDEEVINDSFFPDVGEYIPSYSTIGRKISYSTMERKSISRVGGDQSVSQTSGAPVLRRRNATITRLRSKASVQIDGYGVSALGRSGAVDRAASNIALRNAAFEIDDGEEEDAKNVAESQKYKVVQEEMQQRGRLSYSLYGYYIRNCSYFLASMVAFLLLLNLGVDIWNEFWLQAWGSSNISESEGLSTNFYYLGIFTAGTIGGTFLAILMDLVAIRYMALAASKRMHVKALDATMGAPISFFHANPAGRIINRFSNDIMSLDRTIPQNLLALINALLSALMSTLLACIASYYVIFIAILMGVFYWIVVEFFMRTVRELRRLVLTSQSPTFQFLSESMMGIGTIRGFGREAQSAKIMQGLIDTNSKVFYSTFAVSSWLATTIQFLSFMLTVPVLLITVLNGGSTNAGFLAIALTNALNVGSSLQTIVQAYISMEISLVSIERIKEYIDRDSEVSMRAIDKQITPPPNWPSRGEIKFRDYSTSYAHDETSLNQDLVLKNITLTFEAGMRIGIVGRTGAGKSSMVLALFQLLRARSGTISIDGLDLATIDLQTVRSRLAIIPQEAMVFPGTIRENLDPALLYTDEQLWGSLERVGLAPMVKELREFRQPQPGQISPPIPENGQVEKPLSQLDMRFPGERLSMGESQLFCLCRAILLQSKIVVLDEPTANIDMQTDQHIQRVIREVFHDCTIITIAHRIATIQDFDRVLVLDNGMVKEFGNPGELLRNPHSEFSKLANNIAAEA